MNPIPCLSDDSLMPYGKYRGERLSNVPDSYLLWLYENDKCDIAVKWYIERNLDVIKANAKLEDNERKNRNKYNTK